MGSELQRSIGLAFIGRKTKTNNGDDDHGNDDDVDDDDDDDNDQTMTKPWSRQ